jgi:branched-chain amino acid aminotransferase
VSHSFVSLNGQVLNSTDAQIPALSSAGLVGRGIFTTIAIDNREPFQWEKHWRRLTDNAARVSIDLTDFSRDRTRAALDAVIESNDVDDGRARITFFFEGAGEPWPYESKRATSLLVLTGDRRPQIQNPSLTISAFRTNSKSPLAGVKSCNYLEKILSLIEARKRGFDEAVQLNERGEITSACMANVFWSKSGKLFTPALETGCLAGTTREFVVENHDCDEVVTKIDELRDVDQIFLTSAGIGISQIARFDGRELDRERHPILDLLPLKN